MSEEKVYKCQVCRRQPAVKQVRTSDGRKQWRCQVCADLKNRIGFTNKKQ
jgi:predicted SprT family Zn-dependent metalloprotease